jgi:hypothetical protein
MQELGMFVISKSFKALKFFNLMDFRLHSFARKQFSSVRTHFGPFYCKKKPAFGSKPLKQSFFYCLFPDAGFDSGWFPPHQLSLES